MILEKGNILSMLGKTDWLIFTSNSDKNRMGKMVMGRGLALQLKSMFPDLPLDFARQYEKDKDSPAHNVGSIGIYKGQEICYFMVKDHWWEAARLDIIQASTDELYDLLIVYQDYPSGSPIRVDMNFPGIGNGRLIRGDVLPIISKLPDNVHVWELP